LSEAKTENDSGAGPPEGLAGGDRASALRVVAIAGLLLLLAGAGGLLLKPGDGSLDPQDFLSEVFAGIDEPLSGDLTAVEARRLPTGERLARFAAPTPEGAGVTELTIVEFPTARGAAVLKEQLSGLSFESGKESSGSGRGRPGGDRGGSWGSWGEKKERAFKLQEKGTLSWNGFDADFVRLLHKRSSTSAGGDRAGGADAQAGEEEEAPAHETIRVNLSTGGRCLVAYLRFEEGYESSADDARGVLSGIRPIE